MQKYSIAFLAVITLASFGCKKKGDAPAADKTPPPAGDKMAADKPVADKGSAKPDDKPAAAPGGCAPNADGGFCVTVPDGVKAAAPTDKSDTERRYDYSDGKDKSLVIIVTKMSDPAGEWDSEVSVRTDESKKATNKDVQSSDLPGGGKYFSWVDGDTNWVTTLAHKDTKLFGCRTHGKPTADPAMVEACKSMKPL